MFNAIYLASVLIVAFWAIVAGFRKGISRQLASLLGFGFGAVASRILTPEFASSFTWSARFGHSPQFVEFTSNLVCGIIIYTFVFVLFYIFSGVLQSAMSVFQIGMLNRIAGSFFSLIKNLLWLSMIFNLLICCSSQSNLLKYEQANDGNLMAAVMSLTPAILGCDGAEEFAHYYQLKEAKKISCNFTNRNDVILTKEYCNAENT